MNHKKGRLRRIGGICLKPSTGIMKNRFFLKMMLTYCLVIFLGLGMASCFVATNMPRVLTEMESRIDHEVVQKVQSFSDDKYKAVQNIFARLYLQQYMVSGMSIVDLINPKRKPNIDADSKLAIISSYLQDTCSSNNFISDMFIVDYSEKDIFFVSNVAGRDVSLDYNFFQWDFIGKSRVDNKIEIIPNYIPDYINAPSVNNFSVISYSIFLFDQNLIRYDTPIGLAVINMRADFFKNAYKDSQDFKGNLFVTDKNNLTLFDSEGEMAGRPFPFQDYSASGREDLASNNQYIVNKLYSDGTGFSFIDIVDKQIVDNEVQKILRSVDNTVVLCVIMTLLVSLFAAFMFSKRINALVRNMKDVEKGKLDTRIQVSSKDEIGYLESSFNNMCSKLQEYIQRVYVFELKTKTAELKALQSQINPHFLFNTLESIRITAQIHQDTKTAKMIHMLGNMFRWSIKTVGMFVDLEEELEYVCSYVKLQKLRYDNAFDVLIDVDPAALKLGVPKLVLQPLVENAIHHGLSDKLSDGCILIEGILKAHKLTLTVSDNGKGMDELRIREVINGLDRDREDKDQYHIGLNNVHQRVRMLFGEEYGLTVFSQCGMGTNMTITTPAMYKEEMAQYVQSNHSG